MSIFEGVKQLPPDPLFGLAARAKKDANPKKVDLTLGVYRDDDLNMRTMRAVKEAERVLIEEEKNKSYLPITGLEEYLSFSKELVFGKTLSGIPKANLFGAQSIGGTGALRIGGDLLCREVSKEAYVSSPTWPNHYGIFESAGMVVKPYPYYSQEKQGVDFEGMLGALASAAPKSIVVLQGCCHNPSGADLTEEQWKELSAFLLKRKLIPFFDCSYLGFADSVDKDAWPVRFLVEEGHELLVAVSYSKNFGLYGERTGCLLVVSNKETTALSSCVKPIIRTSYSNPPIHGARVVAMILRDEKLKRVWEDELEEMRTRINKVRSLLGTKLVKKFGRESFGFLEERRGMFSFLGLEEEQVEKMMDSFSVYLTSDGRINLSGLNEENIEYVVQAIEQTRLSAPR